jgi:hypothetical protein
VLPASKEARSPLGTMTASQSRRNLIGFSLFMRLHSS